MPITNEARHRAGAARQNLGARLEAAGVSPPRLAHDSGCDHWYQEAESHFAAGDAALKADQVDTAVTEFELGLAYQTLGDGCVALRSTLP